MRHINRESESGKYLKFSRDVKLQVEKEVVKYEKAARAPKGETEGRKYLWAVSIPSVHSVLCFCEVDLPVLGKAVSSLAISNAEIQDLSLSPLT